ncbi:MAG: tryptophanase [bacterium]|nr:tryptophanase [bacterium]
MRTIIEPFRIKSVEPIRMSSLEERRALLERVGWNLFSLRSEDVILDLLTDSGTGAMSSAQWGALMCGDESYAGSPSFQRFEASVREVFGFEHVVPTHQGRAAEHVLFHTLGGAERIVPNNTHFDTTGANVEASGARAVDLPCPESTDNSSPFPFKGNVDVDRLSSLLEANPGRVPLVMVTVTNNAGGGQPVSLANLRATREVCERHCIPLFLDACRFAENAFLIQQRERGQEGRALGEIVHDMFRLADGCTMSAKKEGLANIGGFVACRDDALARDLRRRLVVTEGFPTYGGMAGRDLEAVAQGLREVLDQDYQEYRHASICYVTEHLAKCGIPQILPAGGHAIFLDAGRFLPHLEWNQFPGQALAIELYLEGGIRSCEIGSLMLARTDAETGEEQPAPQELLRLAIPRRTYTQSHMDYLLEVIEAVWRRRAEIPGITIEEAPAVLRHFTARYGRMAGAACAGGGAGGGASRCDR